MDEIDNRATGYRASGGGGRNLTPEALAAAGSSSSSSRDECSGGGERRRVRITKVEVLINTNVSGGGAIIAALRRYLEEALWTKETLQALIPLQPQRAHLLLAVEVQAPAIEIGGRQRRVHAHFILRIRHAARVVLGRMQPAMQRHLRQNSPFVGGFVSVRLLNAAAENYALKETFLCDE